MRRGKYPRSRPFKASSLRTTPVRPIHRPSAGASSTSPAREREGVGEEMNEHDDNCNEDVRSVVDGDKTDEEDIEDKEGLQASDVDDNRARLLGVPAAWIQPFLASSLPSSPPAARSAFLC